MNHGIPGKSGFTRLFKKLKRAFFPRRMKVFPGSESYWQARYRTGGNSGEGSYGVLSEFKARVMNDFVREAGIKSVIEYGSGDGNQLRHMVYPTYVGFDVSRRAIGTCRKMFRGDLTKKFKLMPEYRGETAELTVSLDVLFHLVEDAVYENYLQRLFSSSEKFVAIYSSNFDRNQDRHERHRCFTDWVEAHQPAGELFRYVRNRYPYQGRGQCGSNSDFYFFRRKCQE